MEEEIKGKQSVFTSQELDLVLCALLKYHTELHARTHLMERFASPEHLETHLAKIALSERLLEALARDCDWNDL